MWTEEVEEQLVSMVEERPSLFAVADKSYSNRQTKTESWRQISEEMNISEKELRKKWDSLRTQFTRYKKLPPSGSSAAEKTSRQKWVLRRLQFLEPHSRRREGTSNLDPMEPTAPIGTSADGRLGDQCQEESEGELMMPIAESTMCDTNRTTSTSPGPPSKRRSLQRDDTGETSQGLMRLIGAVLEKTLVEQAPDWITVACNSIEQRYRRIPPHLQARLDNTIQNVIFRFEEENNCFGEWNMTQL